MIKITQKQARELIAQNLAKDLTQEGFRRVGMRPVAYAQHYGGVVMALVMVDHTGKLCAVFGRNKLLKEYLENFEGGE